MTKFVYIYSIQFIYIIRQIYYIYQHLNNRTSKLYGSCAPTNFVRWKFNISKSTGYICRIKWAVSTLHWIAWLDSASVQYVLCRHGLECWGGGQYILKLPDTNWSVEVEGNISWSYLIRTGVLRWRAIYPEATWYGLECWGGGQYILKLPDTDWSVEVEGNISWSYLIRKENQLKRRKRKREWNFARSNHKDHEENVDLYFGLH